MDVIPKGPNGIANKMLNESAYESMFRKILTDFSKTWIKLPDIVRRFRLRRSYFDNLSDHPALQVSKRLLMRPLAETTLENHATL